MTSSFISHIAWMDVAETISSARAKLLQGRMENIPGVDTIYVRLLLREWVKLAFIVRRDLEHLQQSAENKLTKEMFLLMPEE